LIHMRDHLNGDRRRHSHHGHDRIAHRVAATTGASLEEIRSTLRPVRRRPVKHQYRCPGCGLTVGRRRKGVWSCSRCAPTFDRRFIMRIVPELPAAGDGAG
jgi:ribosomal protein L37AE/L43A